MSVSEHVESCRILLFFVAASVAEKFDFQAAIQPDASAASPGRLH